MIRRMNESRLVSYMLGYDCGRFASERLALLPAHHFTYREPTASSFESTSTAVDGENVNKDAPRS